MFEIGTFYIVMLILRNMKSLDSLMCRELAPFTPRSALGAVDVKETDNAYEFDVDVPGLTKNEIKVSKWVFVGHSRDQSRSCRQNKQLCLL